MARNEITIQGLTFTIEAPYVPGPIELTEGEAHTLNQTLAENVRNNFAKRVDAAKEKGEVDLNALQAELDAYVDKYEFGVRQGGAGRTADPVMREALDIARAAVRAKLIESGKKLKDYDASTITSAAKRLVEANPVYLETARQRVEQAKAIADAALNDLMSTLAPKAA